MVKNCRQRARQRHHLLSSISGIGQNLTFQHTDYKSDKSKYLLLIDMEGQFQENGVM